MNENPYRPPVPISSPDQTGPVLKFRWGLIPATFCWGLPLPISLIYAGWALVLTFRSWPRFVALWNVGERIIPILALSCPPLSIVLAIALVASGIAWKDGRWLKAIVLSVIVFATMGSANVMSAKLMPAVYLRVLWTGEIPDYVEADGKIWTNPFIWNSL